MNKLAILPLLIAFVAVPTVYAGCCFINDSVKCTFWDLDAENQAEFCNVFKNFGMATKYDSHACSEVTIPTSCVDGWKSGDSAVKEIMTQRRNSGSNSGGGSGCTSDWQCTSWTDCSNGVQTRICKDVNNCGKYPPLIKQACTVTAVPTTNAPTDALANISELSTNLAVNDALTGQIEPEDQSTILYVIGAIGAIAAGGAVFLGYVLANRH